MWEIINFRGKPLVQWSLFIRTVKQLGLSCHWGAFSAFLMRKKNVFFHLYKQWILKISKPENTTNKIWEHRGALTLYVWFERREAQLNRGSCQYSCSVAQVQINAEAQKTVFSSFTALSSKNDWFISTVKERGPDKVKNSRAHIVYSGNFLTTWSLRRILKILEFVWELKRFIF